jgi:uncharacterized protein YjiS (DUF1127 family)
MHMPLKPPITDQFVIARLDLPRERTSLVAGLSNLWMRLRRISEARRARALLLSFDDRMLRDIGITRAEIAEMLRHGRPREGR